MAKAFGFEPKDCRFDPCVGQSSIRTIIRLFVSFAFWSVALPREDAIQDLACRVSFLPIMERVGKCLDHHRYEGLLKAPISLFYPFRCSVIFCWYRAGWASRYWQAPIPPLLPCMAGRDKEIVVYIVGHGKNDVKCTQSILPEKKTLSRQQHCLQKDGCQQRR